MSELKQSFESLDGTAEQVDGLFVDRFEVEDEKLYRVRTQPSESAILEHNKQLRLNPGSVNDLSYGRLIADIPEIIYQQALKDGFQFNHPDPQIARLEKRRFLNTPIGKACMVQDKTQRYF